MDSMRKIQDSNQITGGHLCVHRAHKALVVLGDRHAVLPARCFIEKLDCSPYEATNGGFGTIKRGIWNGVDIAVKTLHSRPDISQLKANQVKDECDYIVFHLYLNLLLCDSDCAVRLQPYSASATNAYCQY
jgi:hypothetical protein